MSAGPPVLVVDDEPAIVRSLELALEDEAEVLTATSGDEAIERLAARPDVGVIVTDQRMPGMSGVALLARSLATHPHATRVILTGYTDVDSLLDAINTGHVYQYVTKPWENRDLVLVVRRALERHRLTVENARLAEELRAANERLAAENVYLRAQVLGRGGRFEGMVGTSAPMQQLFDLMERIAPSDAPVLVQGETGTGKEFVARSLHYHGRRRERPIVAQNCAALTETLLESELLGHRRGSFTGATEDKKGLFELADGGTVFLDEIGETSPALQVRLLRVLQEGEVKPVGADRVRHVDVRVISATHRDLEAEVRAGRFREDLFYRLNVFTLRVPPLRERPEDLAALVQHVLERRARKRGIEPPPLRPDALDLLARYPFPGSVRELSESSVR